jgi:hypothetical protein
MHQISIGVGDMRSQPKFESERESQVIFGEPVQMIEKGEKYSLVKSEDNVQGYMKTHILKEYTTKKYKLNSFHGSPTIKLPFGSYVDENDIELYNIPESKLVKINDNNFSVCDLAKEFIGIPYLWGGTSEFGYDCSGFVQRLYKFCGIQIPRNSGAQRNFTTTVESFEDAQKGDLIFFNGHVGLYLGEGEMIHANGNSASVSINNLFDKSVYSLSLLDIFEKIGRVENSLRNK